MVVRRRLRSVVYHFALYCMSGAAGSYFLWHAVNDDRGLRVNEEYESQIKMLQVQLDAKEEDRQGWVRRIALLSGASIDRDLLDEEARARLGRADKDDLIVILEPGTSSGVASSTPSPNGVTAAATP